MTPKRKKVQDYILATMDSLESDGMNRKRYEDMFASMSDKDFDEWMLSIKNKEEVLSFYSANVTNKLKVDDLIAAAKKIGVKLFEPLRMWDEATQSYYTTPKEYLILQLPIRRLSQFVDHKLSVAEGDKRIDLLSGQPVKPDHAGSISQVEIQTLYARGLTNTILELIKYRGGDVVAFAEYKRELEEQGQTTVGRNTGSIVRSAVMMDVLLSGAHIETNVAGA